MNTVETNPETLSSTPRSTCKCGGKIGPLPSGGWRCESCGVIGGGGIIPAKQIEASDELIRLRAEISQLKDRLTANTAAG